KHRVVAEVMSDGLTLQSAALQIQLVNMRITQSADRRELCGEADEARDLISKAMQTSEAAEQSQTTLQISREKAAKSWDAAYGWVRWLRLNISPLNPLRMQYPDAIGLAIIKARRDKPDIEEALKVIKTVSSW